VVREYLSALPSGDRAAVLGGNAQRFWNLKLMRDHGENHVARSAGPAAPSTHWQTVWS